MKKLIVLACLLIYCAGLNNTMAQDKKEVFIEQIEFELEYVRENAYENEYFMTLKLNKGTSYKFKILNDQSNLPGKAVVELLDSNDVIMTNVMNDKYFESINFVCNKTGFYDILIKFQDEKPGHTIIDIFMLQ
jgi:hypothetical protein